MSSQSPEELEKSYLIFSNRKGLDTHYEIPAPLLLSPAPSYHQVNDPHGQTFTPPPAPAALDSSAPSPSPTTGSSSTDATTNRGPYSSTVHQPGGPLSLSNDALPSYNEVVGLINRSDPDLGTKAAVGNDGRVNIRIDQRSKNLSTLLAPTLRAAGLRPEGKLKDQPGPPKPYIPPSLGGEPGEVPPPSMNVVIHVVGSRGL
jgi:hypothetical protein